jgi:GTP-binding protein HflX
MSHETAEQAPRAVLVGVQLPGMTDAYLESSLAEMGRLVQTLGFTVVATVTQKRASANSAAVLGEGKLVELAGLTGGTGELDYGPRKKLNKAALKRQAEEGNDDDTPPPPSSLPPEERPTVVVVDTEMTPSQMRNLEKVTGVEVLDRSGVIIRIFHRHARTKQARLEVEIARLVYEAPRLREKDHGGDRQRGGGTGGKGDNEVELDKRRIRDRIAELKKELAGLHVEEDTRRQRRKDQLKVALVGYTNAGKSSLMRALTGSDVLVADKLFATLGTTVRALHPESHPRILVSDTVGFIKNLPHDLVASFRSTLDEAHEASLLLFVVDASDPAFRSQLEVTREVLGDLGALNIPHKLVLNKVDRLAPEQHKALAKEFPEAIQLSAKNADDVQALRKTLVEFFEADMEEATLVVPYGKTGVVGEIRQHARVLAEEYSDKGSEFRLRAPAGVMARLRSLLKEGGRP